MNNFKENLKESANDKKREIMNIWNEIICSYFIKSLDEVIEPQDKAREKLSRDELIAIYEISTEVKKLILCQKTNHPLFEFLQISNFDVNSEKLLALVDATVKDLCDGMYHAQIIARRYEVSGTFTWSFNDSAMAHDLSGRCMADACTGGEEYVDIIVFTDEA